MLSVHSPKQGDGTPIDAVLWAVTAVNSQAEIFSIVNSQGTIFFDVLTCTIEQILSNKTHNHTINVML